MKTKKKSLLALLLAVVMVMLSGCGGMTKDGAKAYAQSVMDARYKGEFKDYMEQTEATEEEAKELYEGSVDEMLEMAGFNDLNLSEEMLANYRQLFLDMVNQANYKLADAKEADDDAFTIKVTVKPFTAFEGIQDEVMQVVQDELLSGAEIPGEDEINEMVFQKMYDLLAVRVAEPTYGDEQVITINVKPDKDGVYYIPEEDVTAMDEAMFPNNL